MVVPRRAPQQRQVVPGHRPPAAPALLHVWADRFAQELASGALVIPVDRPLQSRLAYYLVYPHDRLGYPRFRLLRDWIVAEAAGMRPGSA